MTTINEYPSIMKNAQREKGIAEMRLQAANLSHSAACMESNAELEIKLRQQIHALQDIILDNSALIIHCLLKQNE